MSAKRGSTKAGKRDNFMEKPESGWAQNSAALAVGNGVYYSFPVRYVGSIQIMQSLSKCPMADKTAVCWEAIARCCDAAGLRKTKKRKIPKHVKAYLADQPYCKVMELKINLSIEGIATSDLSSNEIISNDDIKKISFAAGGQSNEYDFVTYVAKDKRDNRYCHVFDCSILADDVLATIGQIFNLLTPGADGKALAASDLQQDAQKAAALQSGDSAPPVGNPLYDAMAAGQTKPKLGSIKRGAGAANPSYDEAGGDGQGLYDEAGDGGEATYDEAGGGATYDNPEGEAAYDGIEQAGAQFAEFLNSNSEQLDGQALYGEIGEGEAIYGDGAEPGWGYLDVKPDEDLYGGLADVFVDE